ncbi:MAG: DUF177 domain-containing protein [Victivallales bacterium]|nr:DUF177 domain-containing protein [Victivallales bacterium]
MSGNKDKGNGLQCHVMDLPFGGVNLEGTAPISTLDIDDEGGRFEFPNDLSYHLHLSQLGEDLLVTGHLSVTIRAECDRCTEFFDLTLETDDVCHRYEKVAGTVVDLTDDVREDILLVFPQSCLCSEDCRGLCPVCGANLNDGDCGCEIPEDDESEADETAGDGPNPWDALDKLKLDN